MVEDSSPDTTTAPLNRPAPLACLNCRRMHLKCDGHTPNCTRCVSKGIFCSYTPSRRGCRRRTRQTYTSTISTTTSPYSLSTPARILLDSSCTGIDSFNASPTCIDSGVSLPSLTEGSVSQPRKDLSFPSDDDEQLVNLYYLNFHASHPILLPQRLYWSHGYPQTLKSVVELIGSHFLAAASGDTILLQERVERELQESNQKTPEMVQAQLLYAILRFAQNQMQDCEHVLAQAIQTAIHVGMHRHDFAEQFSQEPVYQESLRRTWWELYVIDGCIAAFQRHPTFRTNTVDADVPLPCDGHLYESGAIPTSLSSLDDYATAAFADTEVVYSSFTYRIEAVRLLGRVLAITGTHGVHRDVVQGVDNALAAFMHNLPSSKSESEIIDTYGELDELMFQAHTIVQYATILLHYPRGNLATPTLFGIGTDVPGDNGGKFVCPCTRQHVHSVKATDASKAISMLAAFRTSVQRHSPLFVYPLALGAIVQLSTCVVHATGPRYCAEQHQDRIKLILGVLKSLSGYWDIAGVVLRALRRAARAVFQPQTQTNSKPPDLEKQRDDVMDTSTEAASSAATTSLWPADMEFQDLQGLMGLDIDAFCL